LNDLSFRSALAALAILVSGCGGSGGGSNAPPPPPPPPSNEPRLELFAGAIGGPGSGDGPAQFAQLHQPAGVALDSTGAVLIADTGNRTIRRLANGEVTTIAGQVSVPGLVDGPGAAAQFNYPEDIAVDRLGNAYVADSFNHGIRRIRPTGEVDTLAGSGIAGFEDGAGRTARFNRPRGLAVDGAGNVYVADTENHVIRFITPAGVVSTIAGAAGVPGASDGAARTARFSFPSDVAVDGSGNVYVADSGNSTVRRISTGGVVSTIAGVAGTQGFVDGPEAAARFIGLRGIVVDGAGTLHVTDGQTLRRIDSTGRVTTIAGPAQSPLLPGAVDGSGTEARFSSPMGLALDATGAVLVADFDNDTIRRVTSDGQVTTLVGTVNASAHIDGPRDIARFTNLTAGLLDDDGSLVVTDGERIRRIATDGAVTTLVAVPPAGLDFVVFNGIAKRASGDYVVATENCPVVSIPTFGPTCAGTISRVTRDGALTTIAGSRQQGGGQDGTSGVARFSGPYGIAVDGGGNILVSDAERDTIRRITVDGLVSTLAGADTSCVGRFLGDPPPLSDGSGSAARFCGPSGLVVDVAGNAYVADSGYSAIRRVSPGGIVTTVAGGSGNNCSGGSNDGLGSAARFCALRGLAIDASGILYAADGSTVRRVTPAGEVTTVAGVANTPGFSVGPLPGRLSRATGLIAAGRELYILTPTAVMVLRNLPP